MNCKPNGTCMKQSLYYTWDMQVNCKGFIPRPTDRKVATICLFSTKELEHEVQFGDRLCPAMILVITASSCPTMNQITQESSQQCAENVLFSRYMNHTAAIEAS
eukprot:13258175-Ditylum_brightwellii.AAC.1